MRGKILGDFLWVGNQSEFFLLKIMTILFSIYEFFTLRRVFVERITSVNRGSVYMSLHKAAHVQVTVIRQLTSCAWNIPKNILIKLAYVPSIRYIVSHSSKTIRWEAPVFSSFTISHCYRNGVGHDGDLKMKMRWLPITWSSRKCVCHVGMYSQIKGRID
jgi:hypothetical protein